MPLRTLAIAAVMLALPVSAAFADDRPSPAERAQIEDLLRQRGFTHWGEIERDHRKWEIDDALNADGYKYDVELELNTLALIKLERD